MVVCTRDETSLSVSLHPGVILSISDHYVRSSTAFGIAFSSDSSKASSSKADRGEKTCRVIGCLLGTQNGRNIEIFHCFELLQYIVEEDERNQDISNRVDMSFLYSRKTQHKTIFPQYDVVGWYSTGYVGSPEDVNFHKHIMALTENPLYLCLDTEFSSLKGDLPVTIYECDIRFVEDKMQLALVPISFHIASSQVERIALEHVARMGMSDDSSTSSAVHFLYSVSSAVRMLKFRMETLRSFLESVKSGRIEKDVSILRQVRSIYSQLPSVAGNIFKLSQELRKEYHDTALVNYLTGITKSLYLLNEVVDKFHLSTESSSNPRRLRGAFL
eukprot:jgi/Galph1/2707/GphlegSOOS_G1328.1